MHERNAHGAATVRFPARQPRLHLVEVELIEPTLGKLLAAVEVADMLAPSAGAFDLGVGREIGELQFMLPCRHQKSSARGMRV